MKDMYQFVLNEDEMVLGGERIQRSLQSVELQEDGFRSMALRREKNVSKIVLPEVPYA